MLARRTRNICVEKCKRAFGCRHVTSCLQACLCLRSFCRTRTRRQRQPVMWCPWHLTVCTTGLHQGCQARRNYEIVNQRATFASRSSFACEANMFWCDDHCAHSFEPWHGCLVPRFGRNIEVCCKNERQPPSPCEELNFREQIKMRAR